MKTIIVGDPQTQRKPFDPATAKPGDVYVGRVTATRYRFIGMHPTNPTSAVVESLHSGDFLKVDSAGLDAIVKPDVVQIKGRFYDSPYGPGFNPTGCMILDRVRWISEEVELTVFPPGEQKP